MIVDSITEVKVDRVSGYFSPGIVFFLSLPSSKASATVQRKGESQLSSQSNKNYG
jgi:hypothetical protein